MKEMYGRQWLMFKNTYWKPFLITFLLFAASSVGGYYVLLQNPNLVEELMVQVQQMFAAKDLLDPGDTSFVLAGKLFYNNLVACVLVAATGFIPIFLPALFIIIINGGVMGVLFAFFKLNGQAVLPVFFAGILPHGIFEIPAIVFSGALAFYITIGIFKKLFRQNQFSFTDVLKNTGMGFLLICLPLLLLAAVVEAFITPLLLGMVIG